MSTIQHDFIVVVGDYNSDNFVFAHATAKGMFPEGMVIGPSDGMAHGTQTFVIVPDGHKEGFSGSLQNNELRVNFLQAVKNMGGLQICCASFGEMGYAIGCRFTAVQDAFDISPDYKLTRSYW